MAELALNNRILIIIRKCEAALRRRYVVDIAAQEKWSRKL